MGKLVRSQSSKTVARFLQGPEYFRQTGRLARKKGHSQWSNPRFRIMMIVGTIKTIPARIPTVVLNKSGNTFQHFSLQADVEKIFHLGLDPEG